MNGQDIIVLGGSAGGVEALKDLIRQLPANLPAALLVVIHFPATRRSVLPDLLTRCGRLPATHAKDEQRIEAGRIYVAPPDDHMLVECDGVRLSRAAKENGFRPAIDPLFRSAAQSCGAA